MQARDVMTSPVLTVTTDVTVQEIARLLLDRHISAVPVVDGDGILLGLVSEGDLIRRADAGTERHPSWWLGLVSDPEDDARSYLKSHGLRAGDVMTRNVVAVTEDAPIPEIAELLEKHRIKRVPVVRDGCVVGIVSRANLLQALVARPVNSAVQTSVDDRALREAVFQAVKSTGARTIFVNVLVTEGVAHLWGMAHSEAERDAMRVAAESVPGVKRVEARVTLLPAGRGRPG
ncbi:MAG: CBS domain-containing protein [Betaproteobacteria bacterium]|nr:CBS domain-containing protein [Betaproteobacteria bacterium]